MSRFVAMAIVDEKRKTLQPRDKAAEVLQEQARSAVRGGDDTRGCALSLGYENFRHFLGSLTATGLHALGSPCTGRP